MICLVVMAQLVSNVHTVGLNVSAGPERAKQKTFGWFVGNGGPDQALLRWENSVRAGKALACGEFDFGYCRYAEIYSAIQGDRFWKGGELVPVWGWAPRT